MVVSGDVLVLVVLSGDTVLGTVTVGTIRMIVDVVGLRVR